MSKPNVWSADVRLQQDNPFMLRMKAHSNYISQKWPLKYKTGYS